jgi:argininosuccinate synthase
MNNDPKKVLLAFSGGLDTTYCMVYLQQELGLEVHAVTIDTGGFSPADRERLANQAETLGAASFQLIDATQAYYDTCLRFLIYGNVLKNGTYPLSVSAERMIQAVHIAQAAQMIQAGAIAHGSTGAGNDQVRFDMAFQTLLPDVSIITPIRDQRLSREAEIEYLKAHNIQMNFEKARYSINQGLWGTSVGGRETLTSSQPLPEDAWPTPVSKQVQEDLTLEFHQGTLTGVNNQSFQHPAEAIKALRDIAQPFGIGRDIHVGDTIIGIKGRVGFEAAAPLIILKAHHLLEKHTLTKWQLYWKDQLAQWYGNWLHEGQWLEPVMRDIEQMLLSTQQCVSGKVFATLHPYRFTLNGIESAHDLMNARFGAYGEMNTGWTGEDVRGFAKIFGNQNRIWQAVNGHKEV